MAHHDRLVGSFRHLWNSPAPSSCLPPAPLVAPLAPCNTELGRIKHPRLARAPAMASQTRLDRALEITYTYALHARPRAVGLEQWTGPHQLIVVVPADGLHFHLQYCPRAGPMDQVSFMPLTHALRRSLPRCLLCMPLHRQRGRAGAGPPDVDAPPTEAAPLVALRGPRWAHLTLHLPRPPSPRTRLRALLPFDYVAEWQVLTAFMLAALPGARHSALLPVSCALLPSTGRTLPGWPEMLQAACRFLQVASVSGSWPAILAFGGDQETWHVRVRVPGTWLTNSAPTFVLDLPPLGSASPIRISEADRCGRPQH